MMLVLFLFVFTCKILFMLQRYKKILIYAKKLKKYSRFLQIYLHNSKKSSTFAPAKGLRIQRKLQN